MKGVIDVWYGNILTEHDDIAALSACLASDERQFARTIRNRKIQDQYISTRYRIRMTLASYLGGDAKDLKILRSEHGKPYLACRSLYFNVSHSGDKLAIAVTDFGEIGVDIEQYKKRHALAELAERCFASEEMSYWRGVSDEAKPEAFYRLWTRKEAYVKAIGRGIALGVERCVINTLQPDRFLRLPEGCGEVDDWRIYTFATDQDYCGAVAMATGDQLVRLNGKSFTATQ